MEYTVGLWMTVADIEGVSFGLDGILVARVQSVVHVTTGKHDTSGGADGLVATTEPLVVRFGEHVAGRGPVDIAKNLISLLGGVQVVRSVVLSISHIDIE